MCYHAPDEEVVLFGDFDGLEFGVGRLEPEVPFVQEYPFQRKLPVDEAHSNIAVFGLQRLVDDHNVPVADASAFHAVADNASIESGCGVLDDIMIEVQCRFHEILRRRRETRPDALYERYLRFAWFRSENIHKRLEIRV